MRIEKGCFLWLFLLGFVSCIAATGYSEDASHQSAQDELYNKAIALKRMFYFKPNYVETYIAKGLLYTYLAISTDAAETISSPTIGYTDGTVSKENSVRYSRGREAKEAFVAALNNSTLSDDRKAYVHYKMGELEINVLSDKDEAMRNWKKTVALSPESAYGKSASALLSKNE